MKKPLITLETDRKGETVMLYGDPAGLKKLAENLLSLIERTREGYFEHDHFMTPEWGGDMLTSNKQSREGRTVHHLKVYCIKGERFQK